MAKLSLILTTSLLTLALGVNEATWGRGFGSPGVGGYNPGFGSPGVGGFNPGFGRPGVGGYNPGFGSPGVGGFNPGYGRPGVGGYNPGFGTGIQYRMPNRTSSRSRSSNQRRRSGSEYYGSSGSSLSSAAFDPLTGSGLPKSRFPKKSTGGFGGGDTGGTADGAGDAKPVPRGPRYITFSGLPSDGGMNSANRNPSGIDQRGLDRRSAGELAAYGDFVRSDYRTGDYYNTDWRRRYPNAWYPDTWAQGTAWKAATWTYLSTWFDYSAVKPIYYDYGNTITYQEGAVYVNGQNVGTPEQYYLQAQQLADSDGEVTSGDDAEQWLPLGVFAMTHDKQTKANLLLQLAVNKAGVIRGNYTATMTNDMQLVHGAVDKKTQRAAWTIGGNKDKVIETGIENLTKDEVPCLVHFGKDRTEQWTLVRLKRDDDDAAAVPDPAPAADQGADDTQSKN